MFLFLIIEVQRQAFGTTLSGILLYQSLLSLWFAMQPSNFCPQSHLVDVETQGIMSIFQAIGRMEDWLTALLVAFLKVTYKFCWHVMNQIISTFLHLNAALTRTCSLLGGYWQKKRRGVLGTEGPYLTHQLCAKYCGCSDYPDQLFLIPYILAR